MEDDGRWITTKTGHRVFIKNINTYMNNKIRQLANKTTKSQKQYKIPIEMIERVYNSSKNPYNDEFADSYVGSISPDDFLKLTTTPEVLSGIVDDNKSRGYEKLDLSKIDNGYMFLEIDMNTGKVSQHEGRHRMVLLKEAGYNDVEIMIFPKYGTSDRYHPLTYTNKVVTNQQGTDFSTSIKSIIPLNKQGFELIKKGRQE